MSAADAQTSLSSATIAGERFTISRSGAVVLDAIRRQGTVARSDLPELTLLSQQSVHRLVEDLHARDLLLLQAPKVIGRGKPSPQLALNPAGAYGIGIAIDTNSVRMAVTDLVGAVVHQETLDTAPADPQAVVAAGHARVGSYLADAGIAVDRIAGLGISMQGFRLKPGNAFTPPVPLDPWYGRDVVADFGTRFDMPIFAENNAALGAVAEHWCGAGRGYANFAYLSFNFGFGGGIVLNGRPYLGYHMNAAEISSIYTPAESERRPTLAGLIQSLQRHGVDVSTVEELKTRFDPDWPGIDAWLHSVSAALNQMIRALSGILDPAAIVFGGEAPKPIRERLIGIAEGRPPDRFGSPVPGPDLVAGHIDGDPSVVGAALLPVHRRLLDLPS